MSRILSVLNYKGGTGKTTTVVNLAAGLALRGMRVLAIDLDPQGSLGTCLGVRHSYTTADLLLGRTEPGKCIVSARPNFDLIVSTPDLFYTEGELWRMSTIRIAERVLYYTMRRFPQQSAYDYIFLDCSHAISMLTQNALLYARELVVPVSMDYLAMVGSRQVLDTLKNIGKIPDHHLQLTMIVPTMYSERQRKDRDTLAMLEYYFKGKVAPPIRMNVKLAEAAGHHQSIYEYDARSNGAQDYARLVEKLVKEPGPQVN